MNKPKIIAYLKPSCGWSQGVRAVLRKYDLPFEDRDIINDAVQRQEMIEKSGQMPEPVRGSQRADAAGHQRRGSESFLLANKLVQANSTEPEAPINAPCASHEPESFPLPFRR